MAHTAENGQPSVYARGKLPTMLARWNGAPGDAVRSYGPRIWAGVPAQALLGVTANSEGPADDTTATHVFHEIGLYQLPAGPVSAPANSQPGARDNTYLRLASDNQVVDLLGRTASGANWKTDIAGQVVTGLVSLDRDAAALNRSLPAHARSRGYDTTWGLALGIMAYVLGPAGALSQITPYIDFVHGDERQRFFQLISAATSRGMSQRQGYLLVRTWQRLATGKALAAATGGDTSWFDLPPQSLEYSVSAAAYGGASAEQGPSAAVALGVLGLGGAAYVFRKDLLRAWNALFK